MSKSLGNALDPWEVLDRQGADALRWFMITSGSPWEPRRIGHDVLDEIVRQFLLTLWNVYAFFVTYANAEGFDPVGGRAGRRRPARARSLGTARSSRDTVRVARDGLEAYDATGAGRRDRGVRRRPVELVRAAVPPPLLEPGRRRRRRRCARRVPHAAHVPRHGRAAPRAVHAVPRRGAVAQPRRRAGAARRLGAPVRLPRRRRTARDRRRRSNAAMAAARAIVELGRRVRVETKTRTRQPLVGGRRALSPATTRALAAVLPLVAEELNVKEVVFAESDALVRALARQAQLQGARAEARRPRASGSPPRWRRTTARSRLALARGETVTLDRAMDSRSRSRPTTSTWRQEVTGGLGRGVATAASRWRSTSSSPTTSVARGWRASSCARCRTLAGPPGST